MPFATAVRRRPGRLSLAAPLAVPIDRQPLAAARNAADLLAGLSHDVQEATLDWHDETFPNSWETFTGAVVQHLVRVLERLHGQGVSARRLEPSTRQWAIERAPTKAVDYLEAVESLRGLTRRILRSWGDEEILLTPTLTRLRPRPGTLRRAPASPTTPSASAHLFDRGT